LKIVLCVTSSVASVETVKLAREFRRRGVEVQPFLSEAGQKIIHPNALEFACGNQVVLGLTGKIEHVKYANEDLILVAPATANTISKFAGKIADNHISSLLITAYGHKTPILFVPSMHDSMYEAISDNIDKLKSEGVYFLSPNIDEGKAKFPDKEDIVLESMRIANIHNDSADLLGKNILITVGGTYEAIDPIRGITNKSSGKMGLELIKESYIRGANLTVIAGKIDVTIPKMIKTIYIESTDELFNEIKNHVKDNDICVATAAVSDFKPIEASTSKISSSLNLSLDFKPTEKIIKEVKNISHNIFLVGFKAEYDVCEDEMIKAARNQISSSGVDLVVANDVGAKGCGFGSDTNQIMLINKENIDKSDLLTKKEISTLIFNKVLEDLS
jgi:phosphopantothenoylcysteine decarboxylase/phosphopantothenate--cysteine ligase